MMNYVVSLLIKIKDIESKSVTDIEFCDTSGNATLGCAGIQIEDRFGQYRSDSDGSSTILAF
jgi:hypothetical protein